MKFEVLKTPVSEHLIIRCDDKRFLLFGKDYLTGFTKNWRDATHFTTLEDAREAIKHAKAGEPEYKFEVIHTEY